MKEGRLDWGAMQLLMGFWPGNWGCWTIGDMDDARGEAMFAAVAHGDA